MLKVQQPESTVFHNFKCGEIFCLNPSNYNVICCLCANKIPIEEFPLHFRGNHLSQTQSRTMVVASLPKPINDNEIDIVKSLNNSNDGDNSEPNIDATFPNVQEVLEDEQPIDFDDLNLLQADQKCENDETSVIGAKESSASDWRNDSSDKDSHKASDIDSSLPHPCPECPRSYRTYSGMIAHHGQKHKSNTPPNMEYKCEKCGKLFDSATKLGAHKSNHTNHVCDNCGKTVANKRQLALHALRHTGIRAHKCSECGKDFFTEGELKEHILRHTGKRVTICEICGKGCFNSTIYKAHMRRHTGDRPAKCEVCGKSFYSIHDLNVHAVQHSKARPFSCEICGSAFRLKKALRVHKKLHTKHRNHKCNVCGKTFVQSSGLTAHMRSHNIEPFKGIGLNGEITFNKPLN